MVLKRKLFSLFLQLLTESKKTARFIKSRYNRIIHSGNVWDCSAMSVRVIWLQMNSSWALTRCSWLISVNCSSETTMVSYIINLSSKTLVVDEAVISVNSPCTISSFLTMLYTLFILYGVAKSVRLRMMDLLSVHKLNLLWGFITVF